ncbi:MAG: sterol desaturase family protein [Labilithrix sp.]|nr:sterol desaturase family protein [Labilithrix sp.]MCW5813664.1 sterol desaturase family protein [Labilithrix sp.]
MATLPVVPERIPNADPTAELLREATKRGLTEERRNKVRAAALAEIPWWYSPYAHLAATTGIGLAVLVVSLAGVARATFAWTDLLVIPIVVLFANFFEWAVHRDVLHKRRWPVEVIYDRHTPMHHMVYVEEDMALRSVREFRLVLIPAAGVAGIVAAAAPAAFVVAHFWSAAAGWLFLLSASLFMVSYEVLHLCYHAPKDSFIGRLRLIARLRAHHARHHDPRVMQRYNFNVTVPLFDWIMGTMAPKRQAD